MAAVTHCIRPQPVRKSALPQPLISSSWISTDDDSLQRSNLPFGETLPKRNYTAFKAPSRKGKASQATQQPVEFSHGNDQTADEIDQDSKRARTQNTHGTVDSIIALVIDSHDGYSCYQLAAKLNHNTTYFKSMLENHFKEEKHELNVYPVIDEANPSGFTEVSSTMRIILLNWLCDVSHANRMSLQSLCLAMHILDYVVRCISIDRNHFQLWGAVCLLFSAKMVDTSKALNVDQVAYMADYCFSVPNICVCEQHLVDLMLARDIRITTRFHFAEGFSLLANLSLRATNLLHYLMELSWLDITLSEELPSKVAASALHLTLQTLTMDQNRQCNCFSYQNNGEGACKSDIKSKILSKQSVWDSHLQLWTRYEEDELSSCIKRIHTQHLLMTEALGAQSGDMKSNQNYRSGSSLCINIGRKYDQSSNFYVSTNIKVVPVEDLWLGQKDSDATFVSLGANDLEDSLDMLLSPTTHLTLNCADSADNRIASVIPTPFSMKSDLDSPSPEEMDSTGKAINQEFNTGRRRGQKKGTRVSRPKRGPSKRKFS